MRSWLETTVLPFNDVSALPWRHKLSHSSLDIVMQQLCTFVRLTILTVVALLPHLGSKHNGNQVHSQVISNVSDTSTTTQASNLNPIPQASPTIVDEEYFDFSTESVFLQWPNKSSIVCPSNEYRCLYSAECIPVEWACDRLLDCADGSDEYPHYKKPTINGTKAAIDEWTGPEQCELCSRNYFQCQSSADCIPRGWMCDGKLDCGNDIHGPDMSDENAETCKVFRKTIEFEEVQFENFSSNVRSSDLSLMPFLSILDKNEIRFIPNIFIPQVNVTKQSIVGISSQELSPIVVSIGSNTRKFCSFYKHNSTILCWQHPTNNLTSSQLTIHPLSGDISGENIIAVTLDSNTGNWYLLEAEKDRVILCSSSMIDCVAILDHNQISEARALELDAAEGLLFVAQIGDQTRSDSEERGPSILKTSLDGTESVALVDLALVQPHILAVDSPKRRLFWIDSYLQTLEHIDYDGKNRVKLESKFLISPLGISTKTLRFQVHNGRAILVLDSQTVPETNVNESRIAVIDVEEKKLALKTFQLVNSDARIEIVRPQAASGLPKVIKLICAKCQFNQICVPKFDYITRQMISTTCLQARSNQQIASLSNASLLVYSRSSPGLIKVRSLHADFPNDLRLSLAKCATWFDVDNDRKRIFYIDDCNRKLIVQSLFQPQTSQASIYDLEDIGLQQIEAVSLDQISKNLYVLDSKVGVITVLNSRGSTLHHKRIITGLGNGKSLAVDAANRVLFFTQYGHQPDDRNAWQENPDSGPWIKRASLDGSNDRILANGPLVRYPNCLTFDSERKLIYWGDFNRIERMDYEGNGRVVVLESIRIGIITSFTLHQDTILWSELQHGTVQKHNITSNQTEVVLQEQPPLYQIKVIPPPKPNLYLSIGLDLHRRNCSQLTLLTPNGPRCVCSEPFLPDVYDPTRCVDHFVERNSPTNQSRSTKCGEKEFACDGGSKCIPFHWVCDGHRDCLDITDESSDRACLGTSCPQGYFRCQSRNLCLEPSWRCDGIPDCGPDDNSDEIEC